MWFVQSRSDISIWAARVDGISLNDCVKNLPLLCTLHCLEMRISVERIYEVGDEVRE